MQQVVFLDQPQSWHDELADFVQRTASALSESGRIDSDFASDLGRLDLDGEIAAEFNASFGSGFVVCYHATRLLPHEISGIEESGLDVLADELRERKLADAQRHHPEILFDSDVSLLLENGPLSWQRGAVRNGWLCFVTPWSAVLGERNGLSYLFGRWGGEAIGWTSGRVRRCEQVLRQLDEMSLPAVVEFALSPHDFASYRSAWFVPVGRALGLEKAWAESRTEVSIPPDQVIRVRTSLDPDWPPDLTGTPRSR